jgi:hypothetical protein
LIQSTTIVFDTDWYKRELATEIVRLPEKDLSTLREKYKDQKVWSILIRDTWQFERGYTLKEAEERRNNILEQKSYQTRLFIETDNIKD